MKPFRFSSTFSVLGLAASLTVGSMYVTVQAGVQQDEQAAQEFVEKADEQSSTPATDVQIAPTPADVGVPAPALAPEDIRSDRQQQIVLDAEGSFTGRLIALGGGDAPAPGYTVKVLSKGEVKGVAKTDEEGRFKISGVIPGVGGILAYSANGLLLFGVRFSAPEGDLVAEEAELDMDAAVVMNADVAVARQLILQALEEAGSGELRFTDDASAEDDSFAFGTGEKSTSLSAQPVKLEADGTLKGTINVLDERTGRNREVMDLTLNFLRDGQLVHASEVNNNGDFSATGLIPGLYSVVGTGRDGVFAMGLEVLGSTQEVAKPGDAVPVAFPESFGFSASPISLQNLNPDDISELTDNTINPGDGSPVAGVAPPAPAPAGGMAGPGGGVGGGAGGGGGGIGGGGGLGALIAAGIAGAVGFAVGQNDDPASPAK
jgi:hypothetical protein